MLPEQISMEDKLGGLPWGLPADRWPLCAMCRRPQSMLAQFVHEEERLNLGKAGRVLFVFQCNYAPGDCYSWDGYSGANACFVLDPDELTDKLSDLPAADLPIEPEARIEKWIRKREDLEEALVARPFKESASFYTKLGGLPNFIQNPEEAPSGDYHFVGQLCSMYMFYSPVPSANEADCTVIKRKGRYTREEKPDHRKRNPPPYFICESSPTSEYRWSCEGPNFGDAGTGYIYLRLEETRAVGHFFWQCG